MEATYLQYKQGIIFNGTVDENSFDCFLHIIDLFIFQKVSVCLGYVSIV